MSFTLAIFHLIVFCVILARNDFVAIFHDGCWSLKSLFVFVFWITSMWFSNQFMHGYFAFTRWVSLVFLIYQALLMLVVAYKINSSLVESVNRSGGSATSCPGLTLIILTVLISGWNLTFVIL